MTVYDLFYAEEALTNGSTLRIYSNRDQVDLVCLMDGAMPTGTDEIAIDRMYADNNGLTIGDRLRVAPVPGSLPAWWLCPITVVFFQTITTVCLTR